MATFAASAYLGFVCPIAGVGKQTADADETLAARKGGQAGSELSILGVIENTAVIWGVIDPAAFGRRLIEIGSLTQIAAGSWPSRARSPARKLHRAPEAREPANTPC